MMLGLGLALRVLAAGLAGYILHELTHYAAARLLGHGDARIDWVQAQTVYASEYRQPTRSDYAIGAAPVVVGVVAIGVAVMSSVRPTLPMIVGSAIYTFGGIINDLSGGKKLEAARRS